jgi:predicted nucleic acid-binding Zn ribbon protein
MMKEMPERWKKTQVPTMIPTQNIILTIPEQEQKHCGYCSKLIPFKAICCEFCGRNQDPKILERNRKRREKRQQKPEDEETTNDNYCNLISIIIVAVILITMFVIFVP